MTVAIPLAKEAVVADAPAGPYRPPPPARIFPSPWASTGAVAARFLRVLKNQNSICLS